MAAHKSGKTLITSCATISEVMLWKLDEVQASNEPAFHINDAHHAIFNNNQDKILATSEAKAMVSLLSALEDSLLFAPSGDSSWPISLS